MDATQRMVCRQDLFNPLTSMGLQMSSILVISHFFNLLLKALGQPGPIAQILAGLVLGPTGMSNIHKVRDFFFQASAAEYYEVFGFFCRMLFMFLIGLETDLSYLLKKLKISSTLAYGGALVGAVFGMAVSFFLHQQMMLNDRKKVGFLLVIMLMTAYTACPVVVRLAFDLKFATSDLGRLAIYSSIVNEITCLFLFGFVLAVHKGNFFGDFFLTLFVTLLVVVVNRFAAAWFNRRNRNRKYLTNPELLFVLSLLIGSSMIIEMFTSNSVISCFVIGILFPKEGKSARTLIQKLSYCVHNFILPVYLGYLGFQFDASRLNSLSSIAVVVIMVVLCIGSKISGTLAACHYLNIPLNQGVFIGFCLNLKGHADIIFIGQATRSLVDWSSDAYNLMLITIVINTVISGPVLAVLMRKEEKLFTQTYTTLEFHQPESEVRMLSCVYGPRHVSAVLATMAALSGSKPTPIISYMMHLIELVQKRRTNVSYHELEDKEMSDSEDYGGNDVLEINDAVDSFTSATKIVVHLSRAVSSFANLYEDVCNAAEDMHTSVVILPFHKHQRIDGKMENAKEGVRITNQKILRHAPCSVGIIVERGQAGVPGFSQLLDYVSVQQVATLFFGGPDDREAIAWSKRIGGHPLVNLTVIRFLSTQSSSTRNERLSDAPGDVEVFMSLASLETGNDVDNAFLNDFYNQSVTSGQVGYVEKYVNNGAETVAALVDIGDMYSLFIVGKGGRGHSPLTTEMSDWEECPELGTVGDLLASSDFNLNGSVLVVQQYRHSKKEFMDD